MIHGYGERKKGGLRSYFNRSIKVDFQGATRHRTPVFCYFGRLTSSPGLSQPILVGACGFSFSATQVLPSGVWPWLTGRNPFNNE